MLVIFSPRPGFASRATIPIAQGELPAGRKLCRWRSHRPQLQLLPLGGNGHQPPSAAWVVRGAQAFTLQNGTRLCIVVLQLHAYGLKQKENVYKYVRRLHRPHRRIRLNPNTRRSYLHDWTDRTFF
jgi:hypothetical protein